MNRPDALGGLLSPSSEERLDAARFFARSASSADLTALRSAFSTETNYWVRQVLDEAMRHAGHSGEKRQVQFTSEDRFDILSRPEEFTERIVHEVDRLLGLIRLQASKEIDDFDGSGTATYLDRLESLLQALRRLGKASENEVRTEFVLSELIASIAADYADNEVAVRLAGPADFVTRGDEHLINLIATNALSNAVQSYAALAVQKPEVVVNWGASDIEYWLAFVDEGVGLPLGGRNLVQIGQSTKAGHLGMGLAIVRQACRSIPGSSVSIQSSGHAGTRFDFRWPKESAGFENPAD